MRWVTVVLVVGALSACTGAGSLADLELQQDELDSADAFDLFVFFEVDATEEMIVEVADLLRSDERVSELRFVSPELAREEYRRVFGEPPNGEPLPASLRANLWTFSGLEDLESELRLAAGVREVRIRRVDTTAATVLLAGMSADATRRQVRALVEHLEGFDATLDVRVLSESAQDGFVERLPSSLTAGAGGPVVRVRLAPEADAARFAAEVVELDGVHAVTDLAGTVVSP